MNIYRTIGAALAATILAAGTAFAAPLVSVSGAVCDTAIELAFIAPPTPGVVRCTKADARPRGVKVTARGGKGGGIQAQTRTDKNGAYQLKLRPGKYVIRVENGGYDLVVEVRRNNRKGIDFFRPIVF